MLEVIVCFVNECWNVIYKVSPFRNARHCENPCLCFIQVYRSKLYSTINDFKYNTSHSISNDISMIIFLFLDKMLWFKHISNFIVLTVRGSQTSLHKYSLSLG